MSGPSGTGGQASGGDRFKLLGKTTVLDGSEGRDAALLADRQNEDARKEFILDSLRSKIGEPSETASVDFIGRTRFWSATGSS